MNIRVLTSLIPALVFYTVQRELGAGWGISAGFVAFAIVFFANRESGAIGTIALIGFGLAAASALAGIALRSEKAYLFSSPLGDFISVGIHLFTAFVMRKPLVGLISHELVPSIAGRVPIDHPVYLGLSVGYAFYNLSTGVMRWFMLQELSVGEFMIWSRILGYILSGTMLAISGILVYYVARKHAGGPVLADRPFGFGRVRVVL